MLLKPILGLNLTAPPQEVRREQGGSIQCTKLQNYIVRDRKLQKIGGTEAYNSTALTNPINWLTRSYHKRGDGSFRKVAFCMSGGKLYYGDDVAGTLTQVGGIGVFDSDVYPLSADMQVSGNSILYMFSGEDEVVKYDGNGSFTWEPTTINADLNRVVIGGAVHISRMWYWAKDSSVITYSTTLAPEDFSTDAGDIVVGEETDSTIKAVAVSGETLYVFKNNSIWKLYGRTVSTFQFRQITDKYGLADKRAIYPVGSGFVFMNEYDKELYFIQDTESSITPLTEVDIRLRSIIDHTKIDRVCMTVHDGLFRCAFKHREDNIYPDTEIIYALNNLGQNGSPRWSMSRGAKINCYSTWQQQGDRNELVTGRSDTGKLMYHNRTKTFDGNAINTVMRTGEIVANEDMVVEFYDFIVKGKPEMSEDEIFFRYFLNGRYSDRGEEKIDFSGEYFTKGTMKFSKQALFNDRIVPYHAYSMGNSISFEIEEVNTNMDMEIHSIAFKAVEKYKIRNNLVGV